MSELSRWHVPEPAGAERQHEQHDFSASGIFPPPPHVHPHVPTLAFEDSGSKM